MAETGCGTKTGYMAHYRAEEPPCVDCRRAQARWHRAWRYRTGRTRSVVVDVEMVRELLRVAPEVRGILVRGVGADVLDALDEGVR